MDIREVDWPAGIREKVEARHGLPQEEVESAIFDRRCHIKRAGSDRYALLGKSESGTYIAYEKAIARIITARRMDRKERRIYSRSGK